MSEDLLVVIVARAAFVTLLLLGLTQLVRRHWAIQEAIRAERQAGRRIPSGSRASSAAALHRR